MRSIATLLLTSCLLSSTLGFSLDPTLLAHGNESLILPRQATSPSPCVTQCFSDIFPQFDCPDVKECICHNDALISAVSNCILSSGCNIADAFASQSTQAEVCGYPVRNRSMTITITTTVLFSFAIIAAVLRALARGAWSGGAGYGVDDYVLFLCCLPVIGVTVSVYMEIMAGLGQDVYRLSVSQTQGVLMWYYIGNTFYSPIVLGTKASFCLLYLRVWKDSGKAFRWACWSCITVLLMALIAFEFSTIFICDPPSHIWQVLTRAATLNCIDRNPQLYTSSAFNILMDVIVLLLPVRNILKLNMSTPKKFGLLATFMVGFAVTAVSATQLYFLVKNVSKIDNPSWDYFPIGLWRVTEIYLSIICCCMPMMPGLMKRMFTVAANSVGTPSIVEYIWEKTQKSFSTSIGTDTLNGWSRRRSTAGSPGKWRIIKLAGKPARISGPFDSATGLELGHVQLESPVEEESPERP